MARPRSQRNVKSLAYAWKKAVTCTTLKSSKALNCSIDEFWTGKIIKGMTYTGTSHDRSKRIIPYFPFLDSWTTCPVHAFLTETPCFCWGENMLKESLESNVHLNWWNPRPVLGVETSWLTSQFFFWIEDNLGETWKLANSTDPLILYILSFDIQ